MLDNEGRVIFVGSFSKTMFTGLRIGYAVAPSLVEAVVQAKALYEPISPSVLSGALARFIIRGGYGRHLRRMTRLYGARYGALRQAMDTHASELFRLHPGDAGLHVYANWSRSAEDYALFQEVARKRGVMFRDARPIIVRPDRLPPASASRISAYPASKKGLPGWRRHGGTCKT